MATAEDLPRPLPLFGMIDATEGDAGEEEEVTIATGAIEEDAPNGLPGLDARLDGPYLATAAE